MKVINSNNKISIVELVSFKLEWGSLVKAVVDVEKKNMIVGCELHVDGEQELLESGSTQSHLWGINLYPESYNKASFIEFDSMINMRPRDNNKTRGVDSPAIRKQIKEIVLSCISK